MNKIRVIARIDVKNEFAIKGIHLEGLRKVGNPNSMAIDYYKNGIDEIVFMDAVAAYYDRNSLSNLIQSACKDVFIPITVGGGIRTIDSIQKYTDVGVEKVILGSAAIKDKNFLKEACQKFPNKIALGLDAKDGYLSVSGWKENSNQLTLDFLKEVNDYGASRLIYTDINRDGTKESPNFEETTNVANVSNCPVIISGGVSSIDDIKKAKGLKNIEGIIVGKAIYDGDIKLEELVKELDA